MEHEYSTSQSPNMNIQRVNRRTQQLLIRSVGSRCYVDNNTLSIVLPSRTKGTDSFSQQRCRPDFRHHRYNHVTRVPDRLRLKVATLTCRRLRGLAPQLSCCYPAYRTVEVDSTRRLRSAGSRLFWDLWNRDIVQLVISSFLVAELCLYH
jgi:hypothetical protein